MNIYEALCEAWADKSNGHRPIPESNTDRFFAEVQNHIDGPGKGSFTGTTYELRFLGDLMHSAASKIEDSRK